VVAGVFSHQSQIRPAQRSGGLNFMELAPGFGADSAGPEGAKVQA